MIAVSLSTSLPPHPYCVVLNELLVNEITFEYEYQEIGMKIELLEEVKAIKEICVDWIWIIGCGMTVSKPTNQPANKPHQTKWWLQMFSHVYARLRTNAIINDF